MNKIFVLIFGIGVAAIYLYANYEYRKTDYGKNHKENVFKVINNSGTYGEYQTAKKLENLRCYKKVIYNAYLPKNEKETTEADMIAISEYGIWVIENKNYQGVIYGDTANQHWCQFLGKKKSFFYNPVFQNTTHLRALKKIITRFPDNYFHSIIVFNQAKIKRVQSYNNNVHIFEAAQFEQFIVQEHPKILKAEEIDEIYKQLYPYTQMTEEQKKQHIDNIKTKYKK